MNLNDVYQISSILANIATIAWIAFQLKKELTPTKSKKRRKHR